ncbi:MAG: DUF2911 domain-containing protein [Flavobacteriaceae bacterium]|jgi:hypothetical protein|nr:DUF2911 domain-containing protein [Flavobacteriaceae bacterium]
MKKIFLAVALGVSFGLQAQFSAPAASPRQKIEQEFSMSKISVDYGRPGVKGRKIFGDLVPYGKVWRAGANAATTISFGQSVNFNGKEIPAGTYGLFVIPTEKEWKIILNKDSQQWGAYEFDEKQNVLETTVSIQKLAEKQEWFEISLDPIDENSANLVFKWDDVKTTVPLKIGKPETVSKIVEKLKEIKQIERAVEN